MVEEQLYTVPEVAEKLRVTQDTVRRWLRQGHMKGVRPGGTRIGWRIAESELRKFMKGEG